MALLRSLSGPSGIRASATEESNYSSVFTRDAVMAGVAGLLLGDPVIAAGLARTLDQLRELQGPQGQIASNYVPRPKKPPDVSFGSLVPRLDAASWYLLGVAAAVRAGAADLDRFLPSVRAVADLLQGLEYNGRDLIYVPPGGNWADEYLYHGYILSDQVLRAWSLRLFAVLAGEPEWAAKAERIERTIEQRYWREDQQSGHPAASLSPIGDCDRFDLAACALLGVSGLVPPRASAALRWIDERFLRAGALPPAFDPVIEEGDPDWPALRRYHLYEFRNQPYEYHNGGIWVIWLGWLALALARMGRQDAVGRLRSLVRSQLELAGFEFEEFLHGRTGRAGGVRRTAYSAAGVVFLEVAASSDRLSLLGP